MFDLSPEKLVVIALLALFLVGPAQLPRYAAKLAGAVRVGRRMLDDAKDRVGEELGVDAAQLERLDPRQYHPRRLLRDAWASGADPLDPVADLARRQHELARGEAELEQRASAA